MKKWLVVLVGLVSIGLAACGQQSEKKAVDLVYEYVNEKYEPTDESFFDRSTSNAYVYEDQHNYYVLLEKTMKLLDNDIKWEVLHRVGKENQKVDDEYSIDQKYLVKSIKNRYENNEPPVYKEENVDLSEYK